MAALMVAAWRKGIELISGCPLFTGLPIHVITSGEPGRGLRKQLAWAQERLEAAGFENTYRTAVW
ncbi:MAG: hypothetical protein R3E89_20150 [Thiolinea sp.]